MTTKWDMQEKTLQDLLAGAKEIMDKKGKDYSTDADRFSNFEFSGDILDTAIRSGLRGPNLAFLTLISTKMARLIELLGTGKRPNNEAIEDTFVDAGVYFFLWAAWYNSQGLLTIRG